MRFKKWMTLCVGATNVERLNRNKATALSSYWTADAVQTSLGSVERVVVTKVTPRELGFEGPQRYEEIVERALEVGLKLCPPNTGATLRIAWRGTAAVAVASERINPPGYHCPDIFRLWEEKGRFLLGGNPGTGWDSVWADSAEFVFAL